MLRDLSNLELPDSSGTVARLTAIIEAAPTAMIMVDERGGVVLMNEVAW